MKFADLFNTDKTELGRNQEHCILGVNQKGFLQEGVKVHNSLVRKGESSSRRVKMEKQNYLSTKKKRSSSSMAETSSPCKEAFAESTVALQQASVCCPKGDASSCSHYGFDTSSGGHVHRPGRRGTQ